ncbi:hypothetical protein RRG08_056098 [Elysia crispata]|uniref:Uncharacterized protein n=1 Tax=Elysia crispata TaxID=231223 RepID=A0AAE1DD80_9GAST|nr:hypothetical protein RRG08_056098 [Elysia crispata]
MMMVVKSSLTSPIANILIYTLPFLCHLPVPTTSLLGHIVRWRTPDPSDHAMPACETRKETYELYGTPVFGVRTIEKKKCYISFQTDLGGDYNRSKLAIRVPTIAFLGHCREVSALCGLILAFKALETTKDLEFLTTVIYVTLVSGDYWISKLYTLVASVLSSTGLSVMWAHTGSQSPGDYQGLRVLALCGLILALKALETTKDLEFLTTVIYVTLVSGDYWISKLYTLVACVLSSTGLSVMWAHTGSQSPGDYEGLRVSYNCHLCTLVSGGYWISKLCTLVACVLSSTGLSVMWAHTGSQSPGDYQGLRVSYNCHLCTLVSGGYWISKLCTLVASVLSSTGLSAMWPHTGSDGLSSQGSRDCERLRVSNNCHHVRLVSGDYWISKLCTLVASVLSSTGLSVIRPELLTSMGSLSSDTLVFGDYHGRYQLFILVAGYYGLAKLSTLVSGDYHGLSQLCTLVSATEHSIRGPVATKMFEIEMGIRGERWPSARVEPSARVGASLAAWRDSPSRLRAFGDSSRRQSSSWPGWAAHLASHSGGPCHTHTQHRFRHVAIGQGEGSVVEMILTSYRVKLSSTPTLAVLLFLWYSTRPLAPSTQTLAFLLFFWYSTRPLAPSTPTLAFLLFLWYSTRPPAPSTQTLAFLLFLWYSTRPLAPSTPTLVVLFLWYSTRSLALLHSNTSCPLPLLPSSSSGTRLDLQLFSTPTLAALLFLCHSTRPLGLLHPNTSCPPLLLVLD